MSVKDLEHFVSVLIRGSNYNAHDYDVSRPIWWPDKVKFCYPISNTAEIDPVQWKKTLLLLVFRCFKAGGRFENKEVENLYETIRKKRKLEEGSNEKEKDSGTEQVCTSSNVKNVLVRNEYSLPIVSVQDICDTSLHIKPQNEEIEKVKREYFFNYLNLDNSLKSSASTSKTYFGQNIISTVEPDIYNIPLSSKLGRRLSKRINKTTNILELKERQKNMDIHCRTWTNKKKLRKKRSKSRPVNKTLHNLRTIKQENLLHNGHITEKKSDNCKPCTVLLNNITNPNSKKDFKEFKTNCFVLLNKIDSIEAKSKELQEKTCNSFRFNGGHPIVLLERLP